MRLSYQLIIKYIGYSLADFNNENNVTILMQFAPSGTFNDYLTSKKVDINDTTTQKILIGIARRMMYLHQNQIIHRNLKLDNILLDSEYNPFITDFGLSKYDTSGENTKTRGTFLYMAPEVLKGKKYNGKADVF